MTTTTTTIKSFLRPQLPPSINICNLNIPPLLGLVFFEFDNILGPVIVAQYPENILHPSTFRDLPDISLSDSDLSQSVLMVNSVIQHSTTPAPSPTEPIPSTNPPLTKTKTFAEPGRLGSDGGGSITNTHSNYNNNNPTQIHPLTQPEPQLQQYRVITYPIVINSTHYYRNSFFFSFGLIIGLTGDASFYTSLVVEIGRWLYALQVDKGMLQGQTEQIVKEKKKQFARGLIAQPSSTQQQPTPSHFQASSMTTATTMTMSTTLQIGTGGLALQSSPSHEDNNGGESGRGGDDDLIQNVGLNQRQIKGGSQSNNGAVGFPLESSKNDLDQDQFTTTQSPLIVSPSTSANQPHLLPLPTPNSTTRQQQQQQQQQQQPQQLPQQQSQQQSQPDTALIKSYISHLSLEQLPLRQHLLLLLCDLLLIQLPLYGNGTISTAHGTQLSITLPVMYPCFSSDLEYAAVKRQQLTMYITQYQSLLSQHAGKIGQQQQPNLNQPILKTDITSQLTNHLASLNPILSLLPPSTLGRILKPSQVIDIENYLDLSIPMYRPVGNHPITLSRSHFQQFIYNFTHSCASRGESVMISDYVNFPQYLQTPSFFLHSAPIRVSSTLDLAAKSTLSIYSTNIATTADTPDLEQDIPTSGGEGTASLTTPTQHHNNSNNNSHHPDQLYSPNTRLRSLPSSLVVAVYETIDDTSSILDLLRKSPVHPYIFLNVIALFVHSGVVVLIDKVHPLSTYTLTPYWTQVIHSGLNHHHTSPLPQQQQQQQQQPRTRIYTQPLGSPFHLCTHGQPLVTELMDLHQAIQNHYHDQQQQQQRYRPDQFSIWPSPPSKQCSSPICTTIIKQALVYSTFTNPNVPGQLDSFHSQVNQFGDHQHSTLSSSSPGPNQHQQQQQLPPPTGIIQCSRALKFLLSLVSLSNVGDVTRPNPPPSRPTLYSQWTKSPIPGIDPIRFISFFVAFGVLKRCSIGLSADPSLLDSAIQSGSGPHRNTHHGLNSFQPLISQQSHINTIFGNPAQDDVVSLSQKHTASFADQQNQDGSHAPIFGPGTDPYSIIASQATIDQFNTNLTNNNRINNHNNNNNSINPQHIHTHTKPLSYYYQYQMLPSTTPTNNSSAMMMPYPQQDSSAPLFLPTPYTIPHSPDDSSPLSDPQIPSGDTSSTPSANNNYYYYHNRQIRPNPALLNGSNEYPTINNNSSHGTSGSDSSNGSANNNNNNNGVDSSNALFHNRTPPPPQSTNPNALTSAPSPAQPLHFPTPLVSTNQSMQPPRGTLTHYIIFNQLLKHIDLVMLHDNTRLTNLKPKRSHISHLLPTLSLPSAHHTAWFRSKRSMVAFNSELEAAYTSPLIPSTHAHQSSLLTTFPHLSNQLEPQQNYQQQQQKQQLKQYQLPSQPTTVPYKSHQLQNLRSFISFLNIFIQHQPHRASNYNQQLQSMYTHHGLTIHNNNNKNNKANGVNLNKRGRRASADFMVPSHRASSTDSSTHIPTATPITQLSQPPQLPLNYKPSINPNNKSIAPSTPTNLNHKSIAPTTTTTTAAVNSTAALTAATTTTTMHTSRHGTTTLAAVNSLYTHLSDILPFAMPATTPILPPSLDDDQSITDASHPDSILDEIIAVANNTNTNSPQPFLPSQLAPGQPIQYSITSPFHHSYPNISLTLLTFPVAQMRLATDRYRNLTSQLAQFPMNCHQSFIQPPQPQHNHLHSITNNNHGNNISNHQQLPFQSTLIASSSSVTLPTTDNTNSLSTTTVPFHQLEALRNQFSTITHQFIALIRPLCNQPICLFELAHGLDMPLPSLFHLLNQLIVPFIFNPDCRLVGVGQQGQEQPQQQQQQKKQKQQLTTTTKGEQMLSTTMDNSLPKLFSDHVFDLVFGITSLICQNQQQLSSPSSPTHNNAATSHPHHNDHHLPRQPQQSPSTVINPIDVKQALVQFQSTFVQLAQFNYQELAPDQIQFTLF